MRYEIVVDGNELGVLTETETDVDAELSALGYETREKFEAMTGQDTIVLAGRAWQYAFGGVLVYGTKEELGRRLEIGEIQTD